MNEAIVTLTALWPRLLIAPLGPTVVIAAWLTARLVSRPFALRRAFAQPLQLVAPWLVLLWLPLPGTAALPNALDMIAAVLLCEGPFLLQGAALHERQRALSGLVGLVTAYVVVTGQALLTPVGVESSAVQQFVLIVLGCSWCCWLPTLIPAAQAAAAWRLVTMTAIGWLICSAVLPWWAAAGAAAAALAVGSRCSARQREYIVAAALLLAVTLTIVEARLMPGFGAGDGGELSGGKDRVHLSQFSFAELPIGGGSIRLNLRQ